MSVPDRRRRFGDAYVTALPLNDPQIFLCPSASPAQTGRDAGGDAGAAIQAWRALHATRAASATTTTTTASLSGHFQIPVHATGFSRYVTESSRIAFLRAPGLHLAQRNVAGARVMFPGDLMLETWCRALHTLRKRRCGDDESGDRKCDDRCLHFSVLPPWMNSPRSGLKLDPLRERAASRYGEGAAFLHGNASVGVKRPGDFRCAMRAPPRANHVMELGTDPNRDRPMGYLVRWT